MAGNREGGKKAAETNRTKYGKDFYARIGSKGGKKGHTGGFYYLSLNDREKHIEISTRGGSISRKGKK